MNIKEFIVAPENNISSVIEQILINGHRAVIVIKKKKVLGIVSEGDILKALIYKKKLHTKAENIMNKSFKFLKSYDDKKAKEIFRKHLVSFIPIVNSRMELVKIITLEQFLKKIK
tara:strand:+ start:482 stop:826 length:345 start_codon:yes stop_codon:yes gene_type:complete